MEEELRKYLDQRFDAMDQRFEAVEGHLAAVDRRFEAVEGHLAAVDRRFEAVDTRFDAVDRRIDERFEEAKRYFGVVAEGLVDHIRQVAEGHVLLVEGQRRLETKLEEVKQELGAMIRFPMPSWTGGSQLWRRKW